VTVASRRLFGGATSGGVRDLSRPVARYRDVKARRVSGHGWLLMALLALGACAEQARIAVPPDLPNTTREQFLTLRWALVREPGRVEAVGQAEASGANWDATIALEGVDAGGRVVSRGVRVLRPGFGPGPTPFQVDLVPAGGEREFRLRVVHAQQFARPGR
jgi:hypothetical protein